MDIRIATMHPRVRISIHKADRLADAFFRYDPSSAAWESYDKWVYSAQSPRNRIVAKDVHAMNTTMAARSSLAAWNEIISLDELPALAALSSSWNLLTMSDDDWNHLQVLKHLETLLSVLLGPHRNTSVVTKLLHAKRPHLIPILDSYMVQVLGGSSRTA